MHNLMCLLCSVYVKVGSNLPFPSCLEEEVLGGEQCSDQFEPSNCEDTFSPQFIIDWCNILLVCFIIIVK